MTSTSGADGLLIVDKPAGMTSHDVVAKARRILGTRKIGHAGTLDPMATGVLVLGVNKATRLLTYIVGADKEYLATIAFGASTTTDDMEGEVLETANAAAVSEADVGTAMAALTGDIEQIPSAVSAIKVDGQRAYARVRAGEQVALAARPVRVARFELLNFRPGPAATAHVRVVCSSGTYIRALARDLGARLQVGGHLTSLRRTRVGGYQVEHAHPLAQLLAAEQPPPLLPMAQAAAAVMPRRQLDRQETAELGFGRALGPSGAAGPVAATTPDGQLAAVLLDHEVRGQLRAKPQIVLL